MNMNDLTLPADWQITSIREAYTFTKKPRGLRINAEDVVAFLPMDSIPIGRVRVSAFEERSGGKLSSGTYIENGDLLVAKITPSFENGKQAIVDWPQQFGFATTEVIPLQEIPGVSDKFYLFHLLLHPEIRSDLAGKMEGTTGRQRLSKEVLGNRLIPLPPLPEQRKIAAVLGLLQQAMEQQERLIALTTELKKTLLHQLFTQGLRGEPQKQTEIGPMPESWDVVTLGELVEDAQQVNMRSEGEREIQYIDVSSISREFLRIDLTARHVLKDAPGRARKKVKTGDVIFATVRPTLLRVARVPAAYDEQVCSTAFCVLRDKNKRSRGRYIYYLVQRERFIKQLAAIESGASYPAVTDRQLKEQLIPLPQESEQIEIAATLEACDGKIRMFQRKHMALTDLFRTLLHQLMTAQIRVNEICLLDQEVLEIKNGETSSIGLKAVWPYQVNTIVTTRRTT